MSTPQYTASCLCGDVQLALDAEPGPISICHCVMCRKAQGGPFATNAEAEQTRQRLLKAGHKSTVTR